MSELDVSTIRARERAAADLLALVFSGSKEWSQDVAGAVNRSLADLVAVLDEVEQLRAQLDEAHESARKLRADRLEALHRLAGLASERDQARRELMEARNGRPGFTFQLLDHQGNQVDPPCRCGHERTLHRVNVGGERTGCFDCLNCDEWQPRAEEFPAAVRRRVPPRVDLPPPTKEALDAEQASYQWTHSWTSPTYMPAQRGTR